MVGTVFGSEFDGSKKLAHLDFKAFEFFKLVQIAPGISREFNLPFDTITVVFTQGIGQFPNLYLSIALAPDHGKSPFAPAEIA